MAQVILIEKNKPLNDLISVNLTTYLGVDLIQRKNALDTLNLLTILPAVNLIITNQSVENEETAEILKEYIKSNQLDCGLIVLGESKTSIDDFTINIPNAKDWEQVIHASAKVLGINENVMAKKLNPEYVPVPVHYFLNLENVNCDVYIRIKKTPTEFQFIKRIHKDDTFSKESIKRYIAQGLEFFHIPTEAQRNFTIHLSNQLVQKIDNDYLNESEKIQIMGESYEIAITEIKKLGFTSETIQLSEAIIKNMIHNFEKNPEMSSLLHKVINSETGLIFQRSHMSSIVASEMVKNLNLKDSNAFEKIAYAAFFHDILLSDKDMHSKINSFDELEKANLNEHEWDLVFNHAIDAANLLRKHPEAPNGCDELIKHHHGASNGKGFTNAIERLPILSKVFIIAHNFVLELIRYKELGGDPRPITVELSKRYPSPEISIIIKSLEKTLKKKLA